MLEDMVYGVGYATRKMVAHSLPQCLNGAIHLVLPDILRPVKHLAMKIRTLDGVAVNQADGAHACTSEVLGSRTSQTTSSHEENPRRSQFELTCLQKRSVSHPSPSTGQRVSVSHLPDQAEIQSSADHIAYIPP